MGKDCLNVTLLSSAELRGDFQFASFDAVIDRETQKFRSQSHDDTRASRTAASGYGIAGVKRTMLILSCHAVSKICVWRKSA